MPLPASPIQSDALALSAGARGVPAGDPTSMLIRQLEAELAEARAERASEHRLCLRYQSEMLDLRDARDKWLVEREKLMIEGRRLAAANEQHCAACRDYLARNQQLEQRLELAENEARRLQAQLKQG